MKTVRLTSCTNAVEAHILAGSLEAEGIPTVIHNENNLFGGMVAAGCTGVDVFVYEADLERAQAIISQPNNDFQEPEGWNIVKASREDAEAIAQFQVDMARESEGTQLDKETVLAGVKAMIDDPRRGFYLVALGTDGQPIASLMSTAEWSDWHNLWYWWVQSVYVRPEYRRQGVYTSLYACLRNMARQHGVASIRLYVDRNNLPAQQTYQAQGMTESHYLLYEEETI